MTTQPSNKPTKELFVGKRVWWRDPDRGAPCDGWGAIADLRDDDGIVSVVAIAKEDGGEAEVYPGELYDEEWE